MVMPYRYRRNRKVKVLDFVQCGGTETTTGRFTVMQNFGGTVDLLEAVRRAAGVSKALFASSGNEVGRPRYRLCQ